MSEPRTRAVAAADQLTAITEEILGEVERLPAEIVRWVPAEGVWTVMDNLCHVREFVPYWTAEALRIVERPDEAWGRDHTNSARMAAVTDTARHRLEEMGGDGWRGERENPRG